MKTSAASPVTRRWHDEHGYRVFDPMDWTVRVVPLGVVPDAPITPIEAAALADLTRAR